MADRTGVVRGGSGVIPWNVIVSDFDPPDALPRREACQQKLTAGWEGPAPLNITAVPGDDLPDHDLTYVDAVVLSVGPDVERRRLLPVLGALEEAGVAVIGLMDEDSTSAETLEYAGALIEPATIDERTLCAKLHGLLHQQQMVAQLRKEVATAQRFQGGLKGEIDRMHEELQLAAMVQREFLPRELPGLYGVEFGVLWRPAHYVSGDIYDISRLDTDHIGVFVADAVGHGVPAALMTMVICRSLTTKIITGNSYRILEPSEVLARLNHDMIRRQGRTTRFATAVYAVVNCRTRVMRLAGAGHPPPLLLLDDGTTRPLETEGGLVGVFEDETYEQIEVQLSVNDRLLIYSDGFEQAFPTEQADAYERKVPTTRYREEFERLIREPSPKAMIEAISARLDDQIGSLHQVDDLTLLCMEVGALPAAEQTPRARPQTHASSPPQRAS